MQELRAVFLPDVEPGDISGWGLSTRSLLAPADADHPVYFVDGMHPA